MKCAPLTQVLYHMKTKKVSEKEIQSAIIHYLSLLEDQGRLFFFRSGSGAMPLANGRFFKTGKAGTQDITVCLPNGRYLAIEVKTPNGRQSELQKEVQSRIQKLGGYYIIATSVDEVSDFISKNS